MSTLETSRKRTAIVIGAGIGGTSIAARLAKQGFNVKVYEKNDFSGGRLSLLHKNGHRFDQGPSLYLMPKLFEETFADLGERIEDHFELMKCKSNYKISFHDGDTFELSCDLADMYKQIEKYEGSSEETMLNFLGFLRETHVHYERSVDIALKTNYENWWTEFQLKHVPNVFKLHIYDNVYNRAAKYFKSEKMIKAFTFQSMYIGMSPYDSPAPYNLLQYTEIAEGIWYPKGGFHKVVESLENIATKKFDAQFNYNAGIKEIIIDENKTAKGVRLEDGTEQYADIVVCNADLVYAYNKLLPETSYGKRLGTKGVLTSSSISFYWCLSRKMPEFSVHNIFLSNSYKSSFDQIFKEHLLPEDPSFYIHVPSQMDETAAPIGKESMVVLVPVGHIVDANKNKFDELVKQARAQVIQLIGERLRIENFESFIEAEMVNDPRTWHEKFNLWKGSILGLSHNIPQVLYFRPGTRSHLFKNLYFVGASSQCGTGVPVVLCSSKLLERQILEDCGIVEKKTDDMKIFTEFALFGLFIALLIFYFFIL